MSRVIVHTERLLIREWAPHDLDALVEVSSDPLVVRYITGGVPLTREQTAEQIACLVALQESHGWTRWALELANPKPGEPSGAVGFCGPGCTFAPEIEVGWWLHSALWGRGLATEAARAVVRHCFEVIGFGRLICCVHPDNAASLAVARRAGFALKDSFVFNGVPLLRHEQFNPLADPPREARYNRSCDGAPTGTSIVSVQPDRG